MSTQDLQHLDRQYVWHPFTHMSMWNESDPLVITDADGMYLIDSDGRRYLDGIASLWCNVHGHRVPVIDDAIRRQLDRVAHTTLLGLTNEPAVRLAERLVGIAPRGLKKVFYSDCGATAVEAAFKLAAQYWFNLGRSEKRSFVGLTNAYHGDTIGAMSVGLNAAFHKPYRPLLFDAHYVPPPAVVGFDAAVLAMRKTLEMHSQTIAAVCLEPAVMAASGILVQPSGYLKKVRELTDEFGVLLIADEVAVGFGRTGRMFACEHDDVTPDILCLGKAITGGYLPLAATLTTTEIFDAFLGRPHEGKTFFHGHTYTGNPLACAAALASLDLFDKNKLLEEVVQKAARLSDLLQPLRAVPFVGDVRQCGMIVGIDLVNDVANNIPFNPRLRVGAGFCDRLRKRNVILRPLGDTIVIWPPLVMPIDDLITIVDAVKAELGSIEEIVSGVPSLNHADEQVAGDF